MRELYHRAVRVFWGLYVALTLFGAPLLVYGQSKDVGDIRDLIDRLLSIVNPLIALLFGFAVLAFVRGIAVFIWTAENEEKRKDGKKFMIWGLVGMFVMIGFWGMIFYIQALYFGNDPIGSPFEL